MEHRRRSGMYLGILVVALGLSLPAIAQEPKRVASPGKVHDRWAISLGFFLPYYNTDARVSSPEHEGSYVDLEDDLGFKADDSVFRLDGLFRISKRHHLKLTWFSLNRTSSKSIEEQINWDDYVFDVGVNVRGRFDMDLYKLVYRYMILEGSRLEFGVGAGISYMAFDFGLGGQAHIVGEEGEETFEATWRRSPDIPVPALGATARWAARDNLFIGGDISYLRGSYDQQKARYSDLNLAINWFPWRHVGLGLMYNWVKIYYEDHGHSFTGRFDYRYSGPVLAVNLIF
ncbi:MAG TPA: hypothetical protein ENK19_07160 [Acidobacteria bacterium]|nr:hypothetical protein [Acidobacteriota bacterium]